MMIGCATGKRRRSGAGRCGDAGFRASSIRLKNAYSQDVLVIIVFMGKLLTRKRLQIWIACLAILLNALAPSISHAVSAAPSNMMEICSATGTRQIALDEATAASSSKKSPLHHLQHCPFCMTHADTFALSSPLLPSFALTGGHDLFPALFYHSPSPLFSWSGANPRAPPATC